MRGEPGNNECFNVIFAINRNKFSYFGFAGKLEGSPNSFYTKQNNEVRAYNY